MSSRNTDLSNLELSKYPSSMGATLTGAQITAFINDLKEDGYIVDKAKDKKNIKEVKIKDSDELIVVESFVERFKSGITQLTTGENKKAVADMFNKASESNLVEVCKIMNSYFKNGRYGHKPNLYEISYIFSTAFIEAYHYTNPVMLFSHLPEVGSKEYFNDYDIQYNPPKAKLLGNDKPGDGYKYRGRGLIQITGKTNYKRFTEILNVDFVQHPELASQYKYSVSIIIYGMKEGTFTNKKLSDYINSSTIDYTQARWIVNGTNKREILAKNSKIIENWLEESSPKIPKDF
ncbi:hypothetical protein [Psychrobacter fozii]|uniref:hypothetical protein n=1 Tax=Psychrobacter fozii TaxID=198480 RepID=UPI0019199DFD|nr:hypothetical protein [Psychrobacter fozii]